MFLTSAMQAHLHVGTASSLFPVESSGGLDAVKKVPRQEGKDGSLRADAPTSLIGMTAEDRFQTVSSSSCFK